MKQTQMSELSVEDAISRAKLMQKLDAWDHNVNAIPNYVWKVIRELPPVIPAEMQEQKYCDRNICLSNEYNGISCDECEVMKNQEPKMEVDNDERRDQTED